MFDFILFAAGLAYGESAGLIVGDYVEARSNHVYTCPCLCSSESVTDGREAILAWSFDRGDYQGKSLEGVKVVVVLASDGSLSLGDRPRRAVLYVDEAEADVSQDAVASLLRREYPAVIGNIIAVHSATIFFQKGPQEVNVRIPGIASVHVRTPRLPEDAELGSMVWYGPFISVAEPTMAMTLLYEYRGSDFANQWWRSEPGITSYFGRFAVSP